jgi:diadenosine tetraphosphate (Ap4A) HIT family hydrolase
VSAATCPECQVVAGRKDALGLSAQRVGSFVVHSKLEAPPVPGWIVLAPARHVEAPDALSAQEQRELGPLLARIAAALRAETPAEKVYVSLFAEVLPHVHWHVVARPPGLPEDRRGARLFLEPPAEAPASQAVCRRVLARLAESPGPRRSRWAPVLLSALVWPGAGQLRRGELVKGLLLAGAGLVAAIRLVAVVSRETLGALALEPLPLDPLRLLPLAVEIQGRLASELSTVTILLLLIWVIAVGDALWTARQG